MARQISLESIFMLALSALSAWALHWMADLLRIVHNLLGDPFTYNQIGETALKSILMVISMQGQGIIQLQLLHII